jgi:hypothetical protein
MALFLHLQISKVTPTLILSVKDSAVAADHCSRYLSSPDIIYNDSISARLSMVSMVWYGTRNLAAAGITLISECRSIPPPYPVSSVWFLIIAHAGSSSRAPTTRIDSKNLRQGRNSSYYL